MSDTPISPGSGSVTIAGIAAAMAMSMVIAPGAGTWSIASDALTLSSATANVITPTVGAMTLAGVAVTITKPTLTSMTPTVASLTLTGVASTVAQASGAVTSFDGLDQGLCVWSGIGNGQVGTLVPFRSGKVSLQVTGTFGSGGSIKLQGSNDLVTWNDLSPAALTSAGFFAALGSNEKPRAIRPNCTAGDTTTSLTVTGWFSS